MNDKNYRSLLSKYIYTKDTDGKLTMLGVVTYKKITNIEGYTKVILEIVPDGDDPNTMNVNFNKGKTSGRKKTLNSLSHIHINSKGE